MVQNTHILPGRESFCKQYLGAACLACREKNISISSCQLNTLTLRDYEIYLHVFGTIKKAASGLLIESTEESVDSSALPDVVKWLCLMDDDAARRTPVAVEKVLHNAAFTNWQKDKHKTKQF